MIDIQAYHNTVTPSNHRIWITKVSKTGLIVCFGIRNNRVLIDADRCKLRRYSSSIFSSSSTFRPNSIYYRDYQEIGFSYPRPSRQGASELKAA